MLDVIDPMGRFSASRPTANQPLSSNQKSRLNACLRSVAFRLKRANVASSPASRAKWARARYAL